MVGHGANACSRRPSPGNAGTTLPPRTSQGSAVDSVRSPNVGNKTLGQASPHLDQSGQIVSSSSPPVAPDSEFGPWLIVSCRRGRQRGRGGNVRATHEAAGSAAEDTSGPIVSRGAVVMSLRGALRGGASGQHVSSRASQAIDITSNLPILLVSNECSNSPVDISNPPRDPNLAIPSALPRNSQHGTTPSTLPRNSQHGSIPSALTQNTPTSIVSPIAPPRNSHLNIITHTVSPITPSLR